MAGDKAGNFWVSESKRLMHLVPGRLVEQFPWSELTDRADALLADREEGGVWLSSWEKGESRIIGIDESVCRTQLQMGWAKAGVVDCRHTANG